TAAVNFTLRHVVTVAQPLTLGTVVNGSIGAVAQRQEYDFTLAAPTRLLFDSLSARSDISWQLIGPAGKVINSVAFNSAVDSMALNEIGAYRLLVVPTGSATGSYDFNLIDLAQAAALTAD